MSAYSSKIHKKKSREKRAYSNSNFNWNRGIVLLFLLFGVGFNADAQWMLINQNGGSPDASAALELQSTNKGFLAPRMTTTQMNAISSPATGLFIYNTDSTAFYYYNGVAGAWTPIFSSTSWTKNGSDVYHLNGRVGIGTTGPLYKLDIKGSTGSNDVSMRLNSVGTSYAPSLYFDKANNGETVAGNHYFGHLRGRGFDGTNYEDAARISFRADGTPANDDVPGRIEFFTTPDGSNTLVERMRIDNAGNVGIGTTLPTAKLHVTGKAPATATSGQIQIDDLLGSSMMLGRATSYGFIQTQNSHPLILNPIGNYVGIGTTTPTNPLTVYGDNTNALTIQSANNANEAGIAFQNSGGSYSWAINRVDAGSNDANLVFSGGSTNSLISSLPERMRIASNGNVGIGISSPTAKFHVFSSSSSIANFENTGGNANILVNSSTNSNSSILLRESGTTHATLQSSGSDNTFRLYMGSSSTALLTGTSGNELGIGITSPARTLHIHDASSAGNYMQMTNSSTGTSGGDGLLMGQSGNNSYIWNYESGYMSFRTNGTDRIRIESGGDVGIGTNNPTTKLEVNGKTKTTTFQMTTGGGSNKVLISDGSGNATWSSTIPGKTKSIPLNPGMFPSEAFSGATRGTSGGFGIPVITMTDGSDKTIRVSIPLPSDWNGGTLKAKILFSSSTNTGNIAFKVGRVFRTSNEDMTGGTASVNYTWAVSTTAKGLVEKTVTITGNASGDKIAYIYFRRRGSSTDDTNTGTMYIHGVNLEYTTN